MCVCDLLVCVCACICLYMCVFMHVCTKCTNFKLHRRVKQQHRVNILLGNSYFTAMNGKHLVGQSRSVSKRVHVVGWLMSTRLSTTFLQAGLLLNFKEHVCF